MKISVIIPVYQHANTIKACLESIFAQTRQPDEVIVVNDGSTDGVEKALEPYLSRIKLINQTNQGSNPARNAGWKVATGDAFLFCDADVAMHKTMIEILERTLKEDPKAGFAYGGFQFGWKTFPSFGFDVERLKKMNYIHTSALVRKEVFPGFDPNIRRFQDWDVWLTMATNGVYGVFVPEILFKVLLPPHRKGISQWRPSWAYRIPWRRFGWTPKTVKAYNTAQKIIHEKHRMFMDGITVTPAIDLPQAQVDCITVNYKSKDHVDHLLSSLVAHEGQGKAHVILVENGSGEDLTSLQKTYPFVTLVQSSKNLGFAGGNNLGARFTKTPVTILLNPDVQFIEPIIEKVVKDATSNTFLGVFGPKFVNPDGSHQPSTWRFPKPLDQWLVLSKIPHLFKNLKPIRSWLMKDMDPTKTQDVDQVMGAFFVVRKDVWQKLKGLDERFFLWYEEVDFCARAKQMGYDVRYFADRTVMHQRAGSFSRVATWQKQKWMRQSLRYYMKKHYGWFAYLFFVINEPFFLLMAFLASLFKK